MDILLCLNVETEVCLYSLGVCPATVKTGVNIPRLGTLSLAPKLTLVMWESPAIPVKFHYPLPLLSVLISHSLFGAYVFVSVHLCTRKREAIVLHKLIFGWFNFDQFYFPMILK